MTDTVAIGYSTNVHPGRTLDEAIAEVLRTAPRVRQRLVAAGALARTSPLELGLWLSALAARSLLDSPDALPRLADQFAEHGLRVRSLNGFPYGHFHAERVKHAVYHPSWADGARLLYTQDLAEILATLHALDRSAGRSVVDHASISTLPIGWRADIEKSKHGAALGMAATHLEQLVRFLATVEERHGIRVHVDLEPEPGCWLDRAAQVADFFQLLRMRPNDPDPRRYLGVCHDTCHAAVMFETQDEVITTLGASRIAVGRVQLSSALEARSASEIEALTRIVEPRYLHQTAWRDESQRLHFFEDLPPAVEALRAEGSVAQHGTDSRAIRCHLHVPLAVDQVDGIGTTRSEVEAFFRAWPADVALPPLEVETYTWSVLPESIRRTPLDEGIAAEILWATDAMRRCRPLAAPAGPTSAPLDPTAGRRAR
ncbi:MAG: metabolite traffic protein EboE [Phycisphaeraceae bacterium]|nr:metabolite traffic protein EboE [Phycisphaeraceae bacterium]